MPQQIDLLEPVRISQIAGKTTLTTAKDSMDAALEILSRAPNQGRVNPAIFVLDFTGIERIERAAALPFSYCVAGAHVGSIPLFRGSKEIVGEILRGIKRFYRPIVVLKENGSPELFGATEKLRYAGDAWRHLVHEEGWRTAAQIAAHLSRTSTGRAAGDMRVLGNNRLVIINTATKPLQYRAVGIPSDFADTN